MKNKKQTSSPSSYLKYFFVTIFLLKLIPYSLNAQSISFSIEAPETVVENEPFQVRFILNNANGSQFHAPSTSGIEMLFPPENAVSRSNFNGKISHTHTGTYRAIKKGNVSFGKASIQANGKTFYTQAFSIKVLPADSPSSKNQRNSNKIFVRPILSSTSVFHQETVSLAYKLYFSDINIQIGEIKIPKHNGFTEYEIKDPSLGKISQERYNGRNYYTATIRKSLLIPQKTGLLTIPKGEFNFTVPTKQAMRDSEDMFFGISSTSYINKKIYSQPFSINVKALPLPQPNSFKNALGTFSVNSTIIADKKIKTDEAFTIKLTIKGSGNLNLLTAPDIILPEDFDTFEPKITSNTSINLNSIEGTRTIEYYVIPRNEGEFKIPSILFSYFDPKEKKYKTSQTKEHIIKVLKGENSKVSTPNALATGITFSDKDIAYLITQSKKSSIPFIFSSAFYFIGLILLVLSILLYTFLILKDKIRSSSPSKNALKISRKKLKDAEIYLLDKRYDEYYESLLTAIQSYLTNKFLLDNNKMNKLEIENNLIQNKIPTDYIKSLLEIIDQISFTRFAPNTSSEIRKDLLEQSKTLISNIESITNR